MVNKLSFYGYKYFIHSTTKKHPASQNNPQDSFSVFTGKEISANLSHGEFPLDLKDPSALLPRSRNACIITQARGAIVTSVNMIMIRSWKISINRGSIRH